MVQLSVACSAMWATCAFVRTGAARGVPRPRRLSLGPASAARAVLQAAAPRLPPLPPLPSLQPLPTLPQQSMQRSSAESPGDLPQGTQTGEAVQLRVEPARVLQPRALPPLPPISPSLPSRRSVQQPDITHESPGPGVEGSWDFPYDVASEPTAALPTSAAAQDLPLYPGQSPPTPYISALLGPSARLREDMAQRGSRQSEWYSQGKKDGPRALRWEEARIEFVPLGATVRGVVEEVRPYGAFIGFVASAASRGSKCEDSRVRGFCEASELGPLRHVDAPPGLQVAIRILKVDHASQRIFVSVLQAN